ncbi:MAG: LptF/LptG family permease [Phycisphaerales bacterium]|nr:LptF/LptG family permease [Phycisphaerales bacterium]
MSWILWRYVCVELLKVVVLTTAVLVVVIAFGATIKPLIQNKLDPMDVGKYALLASVPMLQFALPFAAGFAATLVLHRMAGDNEILAMSVSGMPYRKVFAPVFWLGLGLTVIMFLLVNFAVPHFWGMLKEMIARDVTRVFTTTVEKGEALSLGSTQLFADDVLIAEEPPETGADERLILLGVAALETDGQGEPRSEFTARYATVDIHHRRRDALLKLALVDATIYRHDDGSLIFVPKAVPEALSLSKDYSSGPKTRNSLQLLSLQQDLSVYPSIVSRREGLLQALDHVDAYECVAEALAEGGTLELVSSLGIERVRISNARLDGEQLRGDPMTIIQYEDDEAVRRAEVDQADLVIIPSTAEGSPRFELRAMTSDAYDLRGRGDLRTRWPPRLTGLSVEGCPREPYDSSSNAALLETARTLDPAVDGPSERLLGRVTYHAGRLDEEIRSIGHDILARFAHRSAQTFTTFLLLMLGSVLAVLMRGSLPLGIYALAFVPAVIDILLISGGEQMIKYGDLVPGLIVAWSGNGILLLLIAISWWRLSRN